MHFQQIYLLVPKYHSFFWCQYFLQKITVFCPKNYLYSKQQYESCVRDFLVLFPVFVRQKVNFTEKITFADSVSGIRPPDCSKMAKNPKKENDVKIFQHNAIVKSFWRCFVSLVNFSHWSKIHVNIITGSGIRIAFFFKGLTRIRMSERPPSEFGPISGDWDELPNLVRMFLIECYWMLQISKLTALTVF